MHGRKPMIRIAAGAALAGGLYGVYRKRRIASKRHIFTYTADASSVLVAPLQRFGATDIAIAGGKGANLGDLIRAGFAVPPGFLVTTSAYSSFVERADLQASIAAALAGIELEDVSSIERASQAIHAAFLAAPIPQDLVDPICAAYHELGRGAVAVRSSATAEDLPGAAAAGQQETFLDIDCDAALLDAVRACWASLWTARAIAYRAHQGLDATGAQLAVVVQRMVPADAAGVVFTADPVSGARDRIVVNATPGLGEQLVAGLVTPDHLVLSRRGLRITEQRLVQRNRPALPMDVVPELGRIALAVERHFGTPQDIEWAWVDRQFSVLQARPITTLDNTAAHTSRERDGLAMLGDRLPMRPYPIDIYFLGTFSSALFDALFGTFGINMPTIDTSLITEDNVVVDIKSMGPSISPRVVYKPVLNMWRSRRIDPAGLADDPGLHKAQQLAQELTARDLTQLSWTELLGMFHEVDAIPPIASDLRRRYFPRVVPALIQYNLLLRLAGQTRHNEALMLGVRNKTVDLNDALEQLAKQVRDDHRLREIFAATEVADLMAALQAEPQAGPFLEQFAAFLHEYGHREVAVIPSQGAWRNHPSIPLALIKMMASEELRREEQEPVWKQARETVLADSLLGHRLLRRRFVRVLDQMRQIAQIREDTHFYLLLHLPVLHKTIRELGQRLAAVGVLDEPGDVVYLTFEEITAATWPLTNDTIQRWHATVARRRARYATLGQWQAGAFSALPASIDPTALLTGIAASPGTGSGPVRVVHSPAEFGKVQPGDVLVARYTDPNWTPLFRRVAAVVADSGGMASHAAIVAREYGVPAVLGTAEATLRLQDGQRVLVDGNRGVVLAAPEVG